MSVYEQKGSSQQRDCTNRLHGSLKGAVHWSFTLECHHEREESRTQDSRDAYYKQVGNKMQYSIKRFLSYPHIIEMFFLKVKINIIKIHCMKFSNIKNIAD